MATRNSRVTRRDYNFTKPRIELESDAKSKVMPDLEDYDYPGRLSITTAVSTWPIAVSNAIAATINYRKAA